MKIFISIASYQDPLLETTINSAYFNASSPENLIFGICDQSSKPIDVKIFNFYEQINYEHVDPKDSEGPCWARAKIQEMFNNEDFYLQIDSHMQFQNGWDSYLINYINKIKLIDLKSHQNPIITCYPRAFEIESLEENKFKLHHQDQKTHAISYRQDAMFIKNNFSRQIGSIAEQEICHGYLIAAGCLFSTREFVTQIPYDPQYYFYGEELSLMLRAFTRGFGIFHLPATPIFHLYTEMANIKRSLHWDENEDKDRKIKWHEREVNSINRLNELINNKLNGSFGQGIDRDLKDYEYISGVDLINKKVVDETKAFTADFIKSLSWKESPFE